MITGAIFKLWQDNCDRSKLVSLIFSRLTYSYSNSNYIRGGGNSFQEELVNCFINSYWANYKFVFFLNIQYVWFDSSMGDDLRFTTLVFGKRANMSNSRRVRQLEKCTSNCYYLGRFVKFRQTVYLECM